jgi:hypothetical protein
MQNRSESNHLVGSPFPSLTRPIPSSAISYLRQPLERVGRCGLHTTRSYAGRYAETANRLIPAQTLDVGSSSGCSSRSSAWLWLPACGESRPQSFDNPDWGGGAPSALNEPAGLVGDPGGASVCQTTCIAILFQARRDIRRPSRSTKPISPMVDRSSAASWTRHHRS